MFKKIIDAYRVSFESGDWRNAQLQREILKDNFSSIESIDERAVPSFGNAALIPNF